MVETQSVSEALRSEILKLATDGDSKKDKALTAEVLMRIMRVAKTGRDLLMSLDLSPSNLANMLRRPRSQFPSLGPPLSGIGDDFEDDTIGPPYASSLPYVPSSPNENFGMTALREIIAATKNMNGSSPSKLVEALALAKEKGLDDVALELEKQLGVGKEKPKTDASKALESKESKS